jgi:fatty acid desaturase
MLDGASVAELARLLPQRARVSDESVVRSIWDTAIAFGAVVALLCVEWIGRRMLRLV